MAETNILVVDDEQEIADLVEIYLVSDGYKVFKASNAQDGLDILDKEDIHLCLLDIMMPGMNGLEMCKKIRETNNIPIIMLSAKSTDLDKILGLEYGADDYITKPFNILEVKARIKAIMRRNSRRNGKNGRQEDHMVVCGDLKLDREGRRVFIQEKEIKLTAKEFDLLELLVTNPNKVYSREALLGYVWGNKAMDNGDVRTVDVHVRRLREKIEPSPSDPKYVHTKWGVGYYFRA